MTKRKGRLDRGVFITFDGLQARDSSGRDDKFVAMRCSLFPWRIASDFVNKFVISPGS
jgi:hypothetical protein